MLFALVVLVKKQLTLIGLAGEVTITGNTFKHVGQYVLFIRRYSAHTINIVNNVLKM